MKVLDEHGNYGVVVRFTPNEWEGLKVLMYRNAEDEDA